MPFLVGGMIILQALCLGLAFYCLKLFKNSNLENTARFLMKFLKILLGVIIASCVINVVVSAIYYMDSVLIIVALSECVIDLYLLTVVAKNGATFAKNLNQDRIYVKENATALLEVSKVFVVYSIVNAIGGITVAIINNIAQYPNFNYTVVISSAFFVYLLIGVVFYLLHLLFVRSIEIYEENQLTIW